MTALSTIRSHLETRIDAWASTQFPVIKVAYEGIPFVQPSGSPYIACFVMPVPTVNKTVDTKRDSYFGFYQVNIAVPDGQGSRKIEEFSQAIIDLFQVYPKSGVVSIESTPYVSRVLVDSDGYRVLSIRIPYRYEHI